VEPADPNDHFPCDGFGCDVCGDGSCDGHDQGDELVDELRAVRLVAALDGSGPVVVWRPSFDPPTLAMGASPAFDSCTILRLPVLTDPLEVVNNRASGLGDVGPGATIGRTRRHRPFLARLLPLLQFGGRGPEAARPRTAATTQR
jgi:hypothetical protein